MDKQDWLLFVIALLLGAFIVELGAFGRFPAPALNVRVVGQAADLHVVDVAANNARLADQRARNLKELEEETHREFAAYRSSAEASLCAALGSGVEASLPDYLVREVDGPPSSKVIDEELQIMSGCGYTLVAVLPIVGPRSSSELAWGSDRNRDQPVETKTVRVILWTLAVFEP